MNENQRKRKTGDFQSSEISLIAVVRAVEEKRMLSTRQNNAKAGPRDWKYLILCYFLDFSEKNHLFRQNYFYSFCAVFELL